MSTVVYRLFDDDGVLLYVGVTGNWDVRERSHRCTKAWWDQVANVEFVNYDNAATARADERQAHFDERPRFGFTDRSENTRRSWLTRRSIYGPNGYVPRPHYGGQS